MRWRARLRRFHPSRSPWDKTAIKDLFEGNLSGAATATGQGAGDYTKSGFGAWAHSLIQGTPPPSAGPAIYH